MNKSLNWKLILKVIILTRHEGLLHTSSTKEKRKIMAGDRDQKVDGEQRTVHFKTNYSKFLKQIKRVRGRSNICVSLETFPEEISSRQTPNNGECN